MDSFTFMQGFSMLLGMCGIVSVRMFLPAFLTALVLKVEPYWTWMKPDSVAQVADAAPAWLLHPVTIILLGVLAGLEIAALRIPEIKEFLEEDFERYAKPVFAAIIAFGFLDSESAAEIERATDGTVQAGLFSFATLGAVIFGGVTSFLCELRRQTVLILAKLDPDNDWGLQSLFNYLDEAVAGGGVLLLLLAPAIAAALFFGILGILLLMRMLRDRLERKHHHPCHGCSEPVPDAGFICPACHITQPAPKALSGTGLATEGILTPGLYEEQRHRLRVSRRCPACATALKKNDKCQCCGTDVFPGETPYEFAGRIDARAILCFPLFLLLGVLPVIGFVVSLILFRILLLRPYRCYMGFFNRLFQKTVSKILWVILFIILAVLSIAPFGGLLYTIPFLLHYILCRRAFLNAVGG